MQLLCNLLSVLYVSLISDWLTNWFVNKRQVEEIFLLVMSILDMFTQMSGHRTCNLQALLRLGIEVPMGIFLQSEKFVFFLRSFLSIICMLCTALITFCLKSYFSSFFLQLIRPYHTCVLRREPVPDRVQSPRFDCLLQDSCGHI